MIGEIGPNITVGAGTVIELPGKQADVAVALAASSGETPLVCVLLHGGAIALGAALESCDAIVDLWVPGQEAGAGLSDVIFGDYSPAGRAPVTFYHATSDLPDFGEYNEYPSGDGRPDGTSSPGITYRHYMGDREPDFKFGFGLSFTNFSYSGLLAPEVARPCDDVNVSVRVTNIGKVTSDEVVQVYASLPDATVPTPRLRLVAFQRVRDIAPGQGVVVTLTVRPDSHAVVLDGSSVYDADVAVQAGRLVLSVGGGQYSYDVGSNTLSAIVQVYGSSAPVRSCGK
jgi:beta-glucosidase